jgi:hypothetical protein
MAHQFNFAFRMGVQLRSTIVIAVYQQALRQALPDKGRAAIAPPPALLRVGNPRAWMTLDCQA